MLLDCGPGVLGRLRVADGWPTVDAIVITHFHLDHWGDLVPVGVGRALPEGTRPRSAAPARLGTADGPRAARAIRRAARLPRHVRSRLRGLRVRAGCAVRGRGVCRHGDARPALHAGGLCASGSDGHRTLAYSGDAGPDPALVEMARGADLFLCEATLAHGDFDGLPRGHLSLEEAEAAFEGSGADTLLVTHRPAELPVPHHHLLAFDGLIVDVLRPAEPGSGARLATSATRIRDSHVTAAAAGHG